MSQFFAETAHHKIDREKYSQNYEHIFGNKENVTLTKKSYNDGNVVTKPGISQLTDSEKVLSSASYEAGQSSMIAEIRKLESDIEDTNQAFNRMSRDCAVAESEMRTYFLMTEEMSKKITQLEAQLKEANEVIGFYGDENNWSENSKALTYDKISDDLENRCAGKRAREYQKKFEVREVK